MKDADWFRIAFVCRETADVGEAYAMLTVEPGPDIAPTITDKSS